MFLPNAVLKCMQSLEQAGFQAYVVGGCVRDSLLGLTPHDYDLCTDATPSQICNVFSGFSLVRSGEKHGTVGVVIDKTVYEITTFRTEGGYRDSRHPDWVRFVPSVEEDLARRDFTVNAMAYAPARGLVDPWGGKADLQSRILRAVGDPATRFSEDALRILRGVRFAVRFGLTPEPETEAAMFRQAPLMDNLARERVLEELCKLILLVQAEDLLRFAPVLTRAIPELSASVDFLQHSPHHAYDVFTHTAHVVESVPADLTLRLAALLHDVAKPACFTQDETGRGHFKGHAPEGAKMADAILLRLKAPTALRQQVVFLIEHHMLPLEPDKRLLRRRLGKYGEETVRKLLALQKADFSSKGTGNAREESVFRETEHLLDEIMQEDACFCIKDLAVNGNDLLALGFVPGKEIGACLGFLLTQVQDEILANEKEALLQAASQYFN